MSHFIARVKEIVRCDHLHIVTFHCGNEVLRMMSLDLGSEITEGTLVKLVVKPTHVAIAKGFSGEVSYSNQLPATILSCEEGELLSSLKLQWGEHMLESIITKRASRQMQLVPGERVTVFIKASELSISKVMHG